MMATELEVARGRPSTDEVFTIGAQGWPYFFPDRGPIASLVLPTPTLVTSPLIRTRCIDRDKSLKQIYGSMKPPMKLMISKNLRTAASVLAVVTAIGLVYFNKQRYAKGGENIDTYQCLLKQFAPMILSTDPLLVHIEEFVTPFEAEYLISLA